MIYLESESSRLYFELTKFGFHEGSLSWVHYLDRMLALRYMCEPNDPILQRANKILVVEEWNNEDEWNSKLENNQEFEQQGHGIDPEFINEKIKPGLTIDRRGDFQFLSKRKGLSDWIFHQYDVDFHPSIPHGHFNGRKQPKLDCYLGWIYQGSKQIKRLSRKLIIELWNDEDFRSFAEDSIDWYMMEFPRFNWRVNAPRRLPKRR